MSSRVKSLLGKYALFSYKLNDEALNSNIVPMIGLCAVLLFLYGLLATKLLEHLIEASTDNLRIISVALTGLAVTIGSRYEQWVRERVLGRTSGIAEYVSLVTEGANSIDAFIGFATAISNETQRLVLVQTIERILSTIWYAYEIFGGEHVELVGISKEVDDTNNLYSGNPYQLAREHRSEIRRAFVQAEFSEAQMRLFQADLSQFAKMVTLIGQIHGRRSTHWTHIAMFQKWATVYVWLGVVLPTQIWLAVQTRVTRLVYPLIGTYMSYEAIIDIACGDQFSKHRQLSYGEPHQVRLQEANTTMMKLEAIRSASEPTG